MCLKVQRLDQNIKLLFTTKLDTSAYPDTHHIKLEMFYLNSTLDFGIPPVLVFQQQVYYKVDRLLTGLTAQQKGTTARWHSNKTSLTTNALDITCSIG